MSAPPKPPPGVPLLNPHGRVTPAGRELGDALIGWCVDEINAALGGLPGKVAADVSLSVATSILFSRCGHIDENGVPRVPDEEARMRFRMILTNLLRLAMEQGLLLHPDDGSAVLIGKVPIEEKPDRYN